MSHLNLRKFSKSKYKFKQIFRILYWLDY